MKKDTLIDLYRILEAVQKGAEPNPSHVRACFVAIRDELMLPDTEEIVVHIREAWEQSQAAADALAHRVIDSKGAKPLPDRRLVELMKAATAAQVPHSDATAAVAVAFGRLVEEAHGIRP